MSASFLCMDVMSKISSHRILSRTQYTSVAWNLFQSHVNTLYTVCPFFLQVQDTPGRCQQATKYQQSTKYQVPCLSWNKAKSKNHKTAINLGFKYPASSHEKNLSPYFSDHPNGHRKIYCRHFTYTNYSIAHVLCSYFSHPLEAVPQLPGFCGHSLKVTAIKTVHLIGEVKKSSSGVKIEKI